MAYHLDSYDNSLVIDGFEKGIGDSPHSGLSDMRNVNIVSVLGEASVNFGTTQISFFSVSPGTVVSANPATNYITYTGSSTLSTKSAVVFSGASLPTGIVAGTVYWIINLGGAGTGTFQISASLGSPVAVTITATGTGTFTVYNMTSPKHFVFDRSNSWYWVIDDIGQVWTNLGQNVFYFTGNVGGNGNSNGNGLVYQEGSGGNGYVFAIRNSAIDYIPVNSTITNTSWVYGWKPSDGTTGNVAGYLKTSNTTNNSHEALLAPDNKVYFCDANWIGRWYQADPTVNFAPTTPSTYVFDQTRLLPFNDIAQCLTVLGNNILVGGIKNVIYPWDTFDPLPSYPILLPEYNIVKMVTVNTNAYILVGNRGRMYITNGSNVNLYKKIPDHISGTVEPYYTWGGFTSTKNQLYFSVLATTNSGASLSQYGGVWAIDLDTNAIRLSNKLSYGTYAGYATAIIPNFLSNPAGTGLFIGWNSGASTYGIDQTSSSPYFNSEAIIDSDLIPIGTFNKPRSFTKVEYRLTKPLVSGESITIKTRLIFNTSDTGYTTTLTDSTIGNWSNTGNINFKNAQWVQFQIILNSTATSPSYVRLKEIRILGLTGPTLANNQQLSI